jgi:hypothetical protein
MDREIYEDKPCKAAPTQEDLLCDPCRRHKEGVKAVKEKRQRSSGVHSSGVDGKHTHLGRTDKEQLEFSGGYVQDGRLIAIQQGEEMSVMVDHGPHARALSGTSRIV